MSKRNDWTKHWIKVKYGNNPCDMYTQGREVPGRQPHLNDRWRLYRRACGLDASWCLDGLGDDSYWRCIWADAPVSTKTLGAGMRHRRAKFTKRKGWDIWH